MNSTYVNPNDWAAFKTKILGEQPFKKEVSLDEIDIVSEDKIALSGTQVPLSREASSDLRSILGIPVKFTKDLNASFGETARKNLIAMCKMMRMQGEPVRVTLVIDRKSRQIVRMVRQDKMMSMESYFETFESLVSEHKLLIKSVGYESDGGINISTVSESGEFQIGNFADEVFQPGMTFKNSMREGSYIMPYMYRLVCTNGMVNQMFGSSTPTEKGSGPIQLNGSDFKSMDQFYKHIEHYVRGGFFPQAFKDKVQLAIKTKASLSEVQQAANLLVNNSNAEETQIDNYISIKQIKSKYKALGVNPTALNAEQAKNTRTNISVWDVVNGITDFASHDTGFEVSASDRLHLQVQAGNILGKPSYDTQNLLGIHLD